MKNLTMVSQFYIIKNRLFLEGDYFGRERNIESRYQSAATVLQISWGVE